MVMRRDTSRAVENWPFSLAICSAVKLGCGKGAIRLPDNWQRKEQYLPEFLRIADFQRAYNLSRSTVYRLRDRGELRFVHIGRAVRIPRKDAERWYATVTGIANDA